MTKQALIAEAFTLINAFKRHRAMKEIPKGDSKDKLFHELQMYKKIDELELAMRAIQNADREVTK
jgi:hypothetical protein